MQYGGRLWFVRRVCIIGKSFARVPYIKVTLKSADKLLMRRPCLKIRSQAIKTSCFWKQ